LDHPASPLKGLSRSALRLTLAQAACGTHPYAAVISSENLPGSLGISCLHSRGRCTTTCRTYYIGKRSYRSYPSYYTRLPHTL